MDTTTGITRRLVTRWRKTWLAMAGPGGWRVAASWLACLRTQPCHARAFLASIDRHGFIDPRASANHPRLRLGEHVYLGAGVILQHDADPGGITLGDRVRLYGHSFIETGHGGAIRIGADTHIQPGCHIHAHLSPIHIGEQVEIAPCCAFYNYDHGTVAGTPVMKQALRSRGPITVGDGVWLGHGVTVLQNVRIGAGAVIAAGAVVSRDIPENAIAGGVPARVIRLRTRTTCRQTDRQESATPALPQPS